METPEHNIVLLPNLGIEDLGIEDNDSGIDWGLDPEDQDPFDGPRKDEDWV
jgi:hypothetical protein